jgi:hypothetical protein
VGDIPGCIPAVDVFIDRTEGEVRMHLTDDPYSFAIEYYLEGGFMGTGQERLNRMWEKALSGAKLTFIRNPSKSYFNRYD